MNPAMQHIGFIGAGNMAEAMIGALIDTQAFAPGRILIHDINAEQSTYLQSTYGVKPVTDNRTLICKSDIVIFAVKPQTLDALLAELDNRQAFVRPENRQIFISIAAGVRMAKFQEFIYAGQPEAGRQRMPILRAMPNTPALVQAGMLALCGNDYATAGDMAQIKTLLSAMGRVLVCTEDQMDAITAISGSGPAYCFYVIESIVAAGEKLGLTREDAAQLAIGTFSGAIRLLEKQTEDAETLRRKVTSPGGTTEAALQVFENR
ncbi:MAG: pyrroline-5-carboxylate reductase, partial [Thermodesulfobacteriota bacterium]